MIKITTVEENEDPMIRMSIKTARKEAVIRYIRHTFTFTGLHQGYASCAIIIEMEK